jgi:formate dehydrogenase iron-sulfur subunit
MGLTEAGGTDMITILPTKPQDLNFVVAPQKVVNQNLDKIRITASGIMGASVLSGLMYAYAEMTRGKESRNHD